MTVELSEYMRVPHVIVVDCIGDPAVRLDPITLTLAQGYHHLVLRQGCGEQGEPSIANITFWKDEDE